MGFRFIEPDERRYAAGRACDAPSGGRALPTLAQIYEEHANECLRSAVRADDPKQRDMLLRLASAWREDAEALKRGQELHKLASAWRKAKALRRVTEGVPRVAPAPAGPRKA
jgi:hypothetical protein